MDFRILFPRGGYQQYGLVCSIIKKRIGSRTQNQRTEPKTETKTDRQTEQSGESGESKNAYVRFFCGLDIYRKGQEKRSRIIDIRQVLYMDTCETFYKAHGIRVGKLRSSRPLAHIYL